MFCGRGARKDVVLDYADGDGAVLPSCFNLRPSQFAALRTFTIG